MNNNLSCDIIRDLLPSYIDGIVNDETNKAVKEHVEVCENCKKALELMSAPEEHKDLKEKREINFLKKVKKKNIKAVILSAAAVVMVFVMAFAVKSYVEDYIIKVPIEAADLEYELKTDGNNVFLLGTMKDSSRGLAEATVTEKNGVVTFNLKSTRVTAEHGSQFLESCRAKTELKQIYIGDTPIWENGVAISQEAVRIFEARHPYIGDMSTNENSAMAMELPKTLGSFLNELQTKTEPYGWTMFMKNDYDKNNADYVESRMRHYGYLLIATIGNLDSVTFEYTVDGEKRKLTVTQKEADALYGSSVKKAAETPGGVQKLIDTL
ncbi:MAG: DUF4825 domain-containing protein [Clostridia bacterium]|nr:DUF4825 domain-containing protein [Clostridia bacterium]MBQ7046670.1 DUF4825 domain-containing protein [Oscillospiraceae bacterium]